MTTTLATTPLHNWHIAHGGRMVDFAGWSMPVQYSSIAEEHTSTRTAVGLFDISHMGRLTLFGPEAASFLDALVTRRVTDMKPGQVRYALVCNEQGGILDDVLVYRLHDESAPDDADAPTYQVVVNASNRAKIVDWFQSHLSGYNTRVDDKTLDTAMIAVQGPKAVALIDSLATLTAGAKLSAMRYYTSTAARLADCQISLSRTGYTGEDGCEIICRGADAPKIWDAVLEAGKGIGARAIGLGARDTLRLEAAMPLYGHELSERIGPIQAGLGFAVSLAGREFIGSAAIAEAADDKNLPVRIGLQLEGKRVAREGAAVLLEGEPIGEVTSGTFSPTFDRPLAMAYVRPTAQATGTHLTVDIRGTQHPAVVVPLPFYERGKAL